MIEKPDAKKTPFTDALKICPLLSMANASGDEWEHCHEEGCKFHLSKLPANMEKCIFIRLAISLGQIAEAFGKSDSDRKMDSIKRQHGPE